MESVIRTAGRFVGLTRNYLKPSGYLFVAFMKEYHTGVTLMHVKDTKDNIQDIVCEASGPTDLNCQ